MTDQPYPDFIYREDEAIAEPCFRTMLYFQPPLSDPTMVEGTVALFKSFTQHFEDKLKKISIAGDEVKGLRRRNVTPELLEGAETWLRDAPKTWPSTLRISGPLDKERDAYSAPALRIEQGADYVFMDFSVPHRPEYPKGFAKEVTDILKTMPLLCGVMGMGFYLSPEFDSLADFFPRAFYQFRTALEPMVEGGKWGIHKEIGHTPWHDYPDMEPGVIDVGWRTFVSSYYLSRLPDLDKVTKHKDVILERADHMAILTAGKTPIWGDDNEDISAYQAVAAAVQPVRFPLEAAIRGLFGGHSRVPEGEERVEHYLNRFD